jgi:hypothetical protein
VPFASLAVREQRWRSDLLRRHLRLDRLGRRLAYQQAPALGNDGKFCQYKGRVLVNKQDAFGLVWLVAGRTACKASMKNSRGMRGLLFGFQNFYPPLDDSAKTRAEFSVNKDGVLPYFAV